MQSEPLNGGLPLISVVIAVYNGAGTLGQCLDSVLQQTYPHVELILVDGGSTDGTTDMLQQRADSFAYWVSEPDQGIYDAWNKGLVKATGDWICFLGADDYFWDTCVLEAIARQLVELPPEIRIAYGRIMVVDDEGTELYASGQPWSAVGHRFQALMCIPHPGTMHRASLFQRHGGFDSSFRIAGDYDLLLRELKTGEAHFLNGIVMAGVRHGGVSTDPKNTLAAMYEIRRAQKKEGIKLPPWLWLITIGKVYTRIAFLKVFGERFTQRLLQLVRKCPGLSFKWTETK